MDKLQALKVFIAVVKANSFAIAADRLDISPPMVSRYVAWLEQSLSARLFNRTTRRISLTEAGTDYFRRTIQILNALEEADVSVAQGEAVRGTLRIAVPTSFGQNQLMPVVIKFMKQHPNINIELSLENRRVNLVEEGYDLAIRITQELEPGLVARELCVCRTVICASPSYLQLYGYPVSLKDLKEHECLLFPHFQRQIWQFQHKNKIEEIEVHGRLQINDIDAIAEAAIAGLGLTHLPTFLVGNLIHKKKLQIVTIPEYQFLAPKIYAIYASRQYLPPKIRAFITALITWVSPYPPWDKEIK